MALRKRHKIPKKITAPAKQAPAQDDSAVAGNTNTLPTQAEHLLEDHENIILLENVLNQINAFYDKAFNNGKEVLPIFVGLTSTGLLVELSAIRDKDEAGGPVRAADLNVFTYQVGEKLAHDLEPREIAEANMIKGQEQIRLHSSDAPMPDVADGQALAHWRFITAETIQLRTMGIYEIQPENYSEISYGHGIKELGGTEDSVVPLQHFAAEFH